MSFFPVDPVTPREFVEQVLPELFGAVELEPHELDRELDVGLVLEGADGGDWTVRFSKGTVAVETARRDDVQITLVQRVQDWQAPLWQGRPRLIADGVDRVRAEGASALRPENAPAPSPDFDPLKGLTDLRGRIEIVIEGAGDAGGDWSLGVHIGGGPVPTTADATLSLGADEAEAIRSGELHPLEALITGRLQLDGDLGLILQLQAVAMTLSAGL